MMHLTEKIELHSYNVYAINQGVKCIHSFGMHRFTFTNIWNYKILYPLHDHLQNNRWNCSQYPYLWE